MTDAILYDTNAICAILPHRPPFLFIDRVIELEPEKSIVAERYLRHDEFFFQGHFPGRPILPGVIVTDALAQTSGLLWGLSKKKALDPPSVQPEFFFLAAANMKFISPAYPGTTLRLMAIFKKQFGALFNYSVNACSGRELIAKGSLTLAMVENGAL